MVLALLMIVPLGLLAALKKDRLVDQIIRGFSVLMIVTPGFWIGILLLILLGVRLPIFPVGGAGRSPAERMISGFVRPSAVRVADAFHIVRWATDALDEVRREAWNAARKQARGEPKRGRGRPRADAPPRPSSERATALKAARWALSKNPEDLTANQQVKLRWIAATDPRLYRAYLLKEGLRLVFQLPHDAAAQARDRWIRGARRCRIPAFVKL